MSMSGVDNTVKKTRAILKAEVAARDTLRCYCRGRGGQAALCSKTGIEPAALSRLISGRYQISLEVALILDVATAGALQAEMLCPSRAHLLEALWQRHR